MGTAIYVMGLAVLLVGLYAVVAKKNLVKIIVGAAAIDYAVNCLLVLVGYRGYGQGKVMAPILAVPKTPPTPAELVAMSAELARQAVDPLPQAMVLTSIVIGLGLTALMAALAIRLYEKYRTFDTNEIRRLRG